MKLVNPLYHPVAVLAGGILLIGGVRMAKLPSLVMLPLAAGITTLGAAVIAPQTQQPSALQCRSPALEKELTSLLAEARKLAQKADSLKAEAQGLLTQTVQMELLGILQHACDRTAELPHKIEMMAQRLQGDDSILSVQELQQQRQTLQRKLAHSSGATRQQLQQLDQSLLSNIALVRQGQDVRQAQLVSLFQVIAESAGVLQAMQNQLRNANLAEVQESQELHSLSDELREFQENIDVLVLT